ncbi:MAG TPA: Asp23/Gls24 family envelope stress response protein [Anaerolineales bacterium]
MGKETTTLGTIHISPNALATIAYHATLTSYGVVDLAPKDLAEGISTTLTKEPAHGVAVHYNGEEIDIDVHIIIEYGTRITSVAASVANAVRYQVEKAMGMTVHNVNVHVQGLHVSDSE